MRTPEFDDQQAERLAEDLIVQALLLAERGRPVSAEELAEFMRGGDNLPPEDEDLARKAYSPEEIRQIVEKARSLDDLEPESVEELVREFRARLNRSHG